LKRSGLFRSLSTKPNAGSLFSSQRKAVIVSQESQTNQALAAERDLLLSKGASRMKRLSAFAGQSFLFLVTSASALAVLFIFYFIARDAFPFFAQEGLREFFTSARWYPSRDPAEFGALSIFVGSGLVTLGAVIVAVPLGLSAAVCLSDVLPFGVRQYAKPVIEILAAIPSVAYGFFALVVFAPLLQERGGTVLAIATWALGLPVALLGAVIVSDLTGRLLGGKGQRAGQLMLLLVAGAGLIYGVYLIAERVARIEISSGTNALNVSVILGIMALPTIVSVAEDALQAAGRELREGSYALGATRAETILRVILPAASSGICAAVILGMMRAVGETMVVWMASGNAAQIPEPWYNFLEPVRTLTATIAGDMGEADQVTGSSRYHVLFAMALCLLSFAFVCNGLSEWIVRRERKKLGGSP
jgi:phosphate transport system permease protein